MPEPDETTPTSAGRSDPLARVLEWGLAALLVAAPLPFGAVLPGALALLEIGALALLVVWLVRAAAGHPTALPPRAVRAGLLGLMALALLQAVPLGDTAVSWISPESLEVRADSRAPEPAHRVEGELLQAAPESLDRPAALSVDPGLSASALRTGAALAALLLVATTVVAVRGAARLALALLVSAAFQGLYGALVLVSGHDMIWHLPKRHYLDSATGTFVNRNHFAGYLAAALCCGLALTLDRAARARRSWRARRRWADLLGTEGARTALSGLLVVLGLGGLLLSFSRAGIAIGLTALGALVLRAGPRRLGTRLALLVLVVALAAVPLSQVGTGRLAERYAQSAADFAAPGGRATVWSDTLAMAATFPATGTGFGTFSTAYPLFRSPEVRLFYRHAHNDAVQLAAEAGLAGVLLALLVLVPLAARLPAALAGDAPPLAAGLALGWLTFVVHALVDFPFHLPASAATAAALSGALLGLSWNNGRA